MIRWRLRLVWGCTLVLISVAGPSASGQLFDNVELYFSFDEDMFADSSGFNRNASIVDIDPATELALSPEFPPAVGGGGSLNGMGTEDFLEVLGWTGLSGAADRTVAAWIKTVNQTKLDHLVEWGTNSGGQRWTFRVNNNAGNGTQGGLRVEVQGGFIISESFVADDQWHHVAATFTDDGTPNVEDVKLYIDGQQSNLLPPTTPNPEPINTTPDRAVTIGGSHVFSNRGTDGLLDEVVVFSRVLSPEEILQLASGAILGGAPIIDGDVNGDGLVNDEDFGIIRQNFRRSVARRSEGDLNLNGVVDAPDFRRWKNAVAQANLGAIPEPASEGLLLQVAIACLVLRRR